MPNNAPSPLDPYDVLHSGTTFMVGLFTNTPSYDTFLQGNAFVSPSDPSYSDQESYPASLDEDSEAQDSYFEPVVFDGSNYLSAQVVKGYFLYATFDDLSPVLGFVYFAQPLTLGPGYDPISVDPYVDTADLISAVPVNNS